VSATVLLKSVDIQIPGYRILRPLGEGGMASVFLAVQESLDREVALKVMAPALAANSEFTDRFLKEGRITAKLNHPNLVTVFDIGSHGSVYYLAAEYIPGGTLREKIDKEGVSVAETLDIVCDVARGLHFAHQKGFVHRDVKPGNILFKLDGTAVLADFGIAKAMDAKSSATMVGASIGTPDYMSPEQARAESVDGRSDLYSMGAMLYEMLTGEAPYQASDPFTVALMHVTQPVPTLPAEHAWLQPLLDGLMAKVPENRFASGEAFIGAVEQLLAASPQAASLANERASKKRSGGPRLSGSTTRTVSVSDSGKSRTLMIAGGALAALLVIGGGVAWLLRPDAAPAPTPPTTTPSLPTQADLPPEVHVPSPVDGGAKDIELWLTQADTYTEYGTTSKTDPGRRLTFPADENAVDLYRKVLAQDAQNQRAKAGLETITDFYLKRARVSCERALWTTCKVLAEDGLKAAPDSAELRALVEQSDTAMRGG
jgi:serine/threonine-protein kinase PpkA